VTAEDSGPETETQDHGSEDDGPEDDESNGDGQDPATLPNGLRLYGEVTAVERVPAAEVPDSFPVAIWTDEALALRLEFTRQDARASTYFSLPDTDEDDRLATLLDIHGVTSPDDLAGNQLLVDIEQSHPVPVSRDGERRGDRRAFYGVLAGIAPSFVFTLLSFFGLADAVISLVPFVLYLVCTFVVLPPSLYIDAWYLRTTTDWEGRPLRWGVLAIVPIVNIAVVPYYLITRENSRPLAPAAANVS
jgi:hypothetical protein